MIQAEYAMKGEAPTPSGVGLLIYLVLLSALLNATSFFTFNRFRLTLAA